jgi:O-antigen/teichoic acid export membrane protein
VSRPTLGAAAGSPLVRALVSVLSGQLASAVIGVVFWTIVTHLLPVRSVGFVSAVTSSFLLVGTFAMLGLGTLLIAELPRLQDGRRHQVVGSALALAASVGLLLGAGWAVLAPHVGHSYAGLADSSLDRVLLALGCGLTAATAVYDEATLGVGGLLQVRRNLVASASKTLALPVLALVVSVTASEVLAVWVLTLALSLVAVRRGTSRALGGPLGRGIGLSRLRGYGRELLGHHVLNLSLQISPLLLPVVVAVVVDATGNGYFATVRFVAGFVFLLPFALTIALFASSANDESAGHERMRRTLPLGLVLSAGTYLVVFVSAPLVLHVFGGAYADGGAGALRIYALAGLPLVVKDHYVALRRMQRRMTDAARAIGVGTVAEVTTAAVGASLGGLEGACLGYVLALVVEACCMAPAVWQVARPPSRGRHARDTAPVPTRPVADRRTTTLTEDVHELA